MIIKIVHKELSDVEYISEISRHNPKVIERFYNVCVKYFMQSYKGIFKRQDIKEDIFQQSFVKLWTEIETGRIFTDNNGMIYRYDKKGNVRQMTCNLKTFLIDIAKNDYRDWLRHDKLTLEEDFESLAHTMEVKLSVRQYETTESLQERIVSECVFELPPRCKEILTMFYYEGMSLDEILKARGEKNVSKNGLKTGKYKCMEYLKSKVREQYDRYHLRYI